MSTLSDLGISTEAVPAWRALCSALDSLADEGRQTLCQQWPDQWAADATPTARREAAEACGYCPALALCAAYAEAANENYGVWGGIDRSQRRPKAQARNAA